MDPKNVGFPVPGAIRPSEVKQVRVTTTFIPGQREDLSTNRVQDFPPAMDQISQTRYPEVTTQPTIMERTKEKASETAASAKTSLAHAADVTKEKASEAAASAKTSLAHAADVTKEKASEAAVATKDTLVHAAEVTKEKLVYAAGATKDYLAGLATTTKEKVHEWTTSDKDTDVPVRVEVKEINTAQGKPADYNKNVSDLAYSDANRVGAAVTEFGLPAGVKTQSGPVTETTQVRDIKRQF